MKDDAKEDMLRMIEEAVSSKMLNQQATITFNLEDVDAENRLKKMLSVDKYALCLYDMTQFFRSTLKYESEKTIRHCSSSGEYKDIILDYDTVEYISNQFYQFLAERNVYQEDLY